MNFQDIKKKDLNQKPRKIRNWRERCKIQGAITLLTHIGSTHLLDEISGIDYVKSIPKKVDCKEFVIGKQDPEKLVPGILEHNGNPVTGETIVYANNINQPTHVGILQDDGRVLSKWGDYGPVMLHEWDQVLFDYGKYAFFSTYSSLKTQENYIESYIT